MTDCSKWNIETLKHFMDERLDEAQRRSDERLHQLQESSRIEREQIDKRFEAANRYKETYSETLSKLSNDSLRREEVNSRFAVLQEKVESLNRTNWPLYSSFGGIIISMVVGLWVIIGLKIDATNQPVVVSLEQTKIANESRDKSISDLRAELLREQQSGNTESNQRNRDLSTLLQQSEGSKTDRNQLNERMRLVEEKVSASRQADANSTTDRANLNDRVQKLETTMSANTADRKATEASLSAALIEIETQFCASDIVRNLIHANDLRVMSILWAHSKLGEYPINNAFYPSVCNRNIKK